MNIAFAGLRHGHIYAIYDNAIQSDKYKVLGAYETFEPAVAEAKEKGLECNYATLEELLADERVDAVALGGCYAERGAMAIKALKAGKHVIADKPLCTTLEELDEIERLAKANNLFVSCMYTMRFHPLVIAVKELVDNGVLGEINNVYFGGQHPLQYGRRPMWYFEEGKHGGVINDIAIHGIDILKFALNLEVDEVIGARCWNKYAKEAPNFKDSAQLMITATNGAGIIADVSYASPDGIEFGLPYYWDFTIWGTDGTLKFNVKDQVITYYVAGDKEPKFIEPKEPKCDYLTDFYNLTQGKDDIILPMEDTIASTRYTLMIQKEADKR